MPPMPAVEDVMTMLPRAALTHGGDGVLDAEPDAADVDGHDAVEDVDGVFGNQGQVALDTGVREEDVDAAPAIDGCADVGLGLVGVGDVGSGEAGLVFADG